MDKLYLLLVAALGILFVITMTVLVGMGIGWMVGIIAEYAVGHDLPYTPFALGGVLFVMLVNMIKSD
jgi:ABC-type Na+ efflux pump permease subunit